MLNSKQRARLRAFANTMDPIFQIGKGGINDAMCESVAAALEARELIKISVLDNSSQSAREAADEIALRTQSEVVGVIGRKIILYKMSGKAENRKYSLEIK